MESKCKDHCSASAAGTEGGDTDWRIHRGWRRLLERAGGVVSGQGSDQGLSVTLTS